jgi:hypothetical protein
MKAPTFKMFDGNVFTKSSRSEHGRKNEECDRLAKALRARGLHVRVCEHEGKYYLYTRRA